jgi:hypothetical protein
MPFCPCSSRVDLRPSPGLVLLLCWRENPGQPGTSAPAADSRRFQPDGGSCRNAAHWRNPPAPDHTNAFEHQRAQQARPSFTPAQTGPAATHAMPSAHHSAGGSSHLETRSTTTHSNKKCLLSISKPRRTMLLCLSMARMMFSYSICGSSGNGVLGCCVRTRQGGATPGGGQALIRSRGQRVMVWTGGGRQIVRRPARVRQPIRGSGRPRSSVGCQSAAWRRWG